MRYSTNNSITPVKNDADSSMYFLDVRKYYDNYYGQKARRGKVRIIIELDLDDLQGFDKREYSPMYPYAPTYPTYPSYPQYPDNHPPYWETNPYSISC